MKVYKFGGASVKDANGVRNLKEIVAQSSDDLMVVISAMGKTTNALERVVAALAKGDEQTAEQEWLNVLDQHVYIMQDLGLQPNVVVAHGLRCPTACRIFPDQCSNRYPLYCKAGS